MKISGPHKGASGKGPRPKTVPGTGQKVSKIFIDMPFACRAKNVNKVSKEHFRTMLGFFPDNFRADNPVKSPAPLWGALSKLSVSFSGPNQESVNHC